MVTGFARGKIPRIQGKLDLVDIHLTPTYTKKTKVLCNMFTTFPYHEDRMRKVWHQPNQLYQLTNPKAPQRHHQKKEWMRHRMCLITTMFDDVSCLNEDNSGCSAACCTRLNHSSAWRCQCQIASNTTQIKCTGRMCWTSSKVCKQMKIHSVCFFLCFHTNIHINRYVVCNCIYYIYIYMHTIILH